jgi:phosphomannomutase/phosphoglucomutase
VSVVLLVAFAVAYFAWSKQVEQESLRRLESCSGVLARDLGIRVAALQGRIGEWGADPRLRDLLRGRDPDQLRAEERSLTLRMPDALGVRLLPSDHEAGVEDGARSLSYAGLDLVHQAERQRRVTDLEVHRLGGPERHLAIAGPVFDEPGAAVVGVIHVALPLSLLPQLQDAGGDRARVLYQQRVGSKVAILPGPDGAVPPGVPDHEAAVPGTRLQVVAWTTGEEGLNTVSLLIAAGAYLILMLLVAAALLLPLWAVKRALAADYAGLVALVEDAVNKQPLRRMKCALLESKPAIEVISRLLRESKSGRGDARQALRGSAVQVDSVAGPDQTPEATARGADSGSSRRRKVAASVPAEIFRAYDIRGVVGRDLTPGLMRDIGRAVGTEASASGDQTVIVGRDTRRSGPQLTEALVEGVRASGCDVLNLGVVPTPLLYFATRYRGEASGAMVTASHNPEEYNGLKVVIGGNSLAGDRVAALRERILNRSFTRGDGQYQLGDLVGDYIGHIKRDVTIARTLKLVVDCGNAAASRVAPALYRALDCDLVELNCNPDAGFPGGRVPDPTRSECLETLQHAVVAEGADLGFAYDGDGDRLGVVDSSGKIIWPDRLLMLMAADVLSRNPGTDVVYDVKCSHHLATEILRNGGRPVMWKSGHSPLKDKLRETGALLAGEWSGHIIFKERWFGFDDALYAGARLLELLAFDRRPTAEVFAALPEAAGTEELLLPLPEGESKRIMAAVLEQARRLDGVELNRVDGLRANFEHGWGLVRASNTQPALVFRFEGDDRTELERIQGLFRRLMNSAAPDVALPF